MSPWPFVIAAYSVTIVATVALLVWSFVGMSRAEAGAAELKRR